MEIIFVMKIGDLVKHKIIQEWVGIIVKRQVSRHGMLNLINWTDGLKGAYWDKEIEAMK